METVGAVPRRIVGGGLGNLGLGFWGSGIRVFRLWDIWLMGFSRSVFGRVYGDKVFLDPEGLRLGFRVESLTCRV